MAKQRTMRFLLAILPASAVAALILQAFAQTAPVNQGRAETRRLVNLRETVVVQRDERAIPYLEAKNEDDLYFAQGYITASDRLWQMDLLRRTARGELAEIMGGNLVEGDKQLRTYDFASIAKSSLSDLSPLFRRALESYARGVNAFLDSCDDHSLPLEFRLLKYRPDAWRAEDSLVIGKLLSLMLSTSWDTDLMRELLSHLPPDRLRALLPEASPLDVILIGKDEAKAKPAAPRPRRRASLETASERALLAASLSAARSIQGLFGRIGLLSENHAVSNNWVVSGKRTLSGKPLLANDPHLHPTAPGIWYLIHLTGPGLRVAGGALPGVPGVMIGHNERIAWGVTNLPADVQDVYLERFDPHHPLRYKTPEGWSEANVRRETIKVRQDFAKLTTDTISFEVTTTRHGPIILQRGERKYALQWPSLNLKSAPLEAFYFINRARNWSEFCSALRRYQEAPQNFIYADDSGHIGYYGAGAIPMRKAGDGVLPVDGSTDEGEWTGFIPFEKLPHLYDPPSGAIVTANNRIVGSNYPYLITRDWAQPYRARRILDLLQAKKRLTVEDCRAIQGDVYSFGGSIFAREVVRSASEQARAANDARWLETLRSFETWNSEVRSDSRTALLISEMRIIFRQRILAEVLGPDLWPEYGWSNGDTFIDNLLINQPRAWLPKGFNTYADLFYACFIDARKSLHQRIGPDESQWEWGRASSTQVLFPHALRHVPFMGLRFKIPSFPQNGSSVSLVTVNAGADVSMRFIADLNDWDNSRMGIPLGESGDPSSPHWTDQLDDWRRVTLRSLPFSTPAIAEARRTLLRLTPLTTP